MNASEQLPQPLRNAAHRAIFHLLEEPVRGLADPFPALDPLPGAYRLYLPSHGLTIWYTVTESPDGQVVIVVQYVKADTYTFGNKGFRPGESIHSGPGLARPSGPASAKSGEA